MDPNNLDLSLSEKKTQIPDQMWVTKLPPISFQEKKKNICVIKNLVHRKRVKMTQENL